MKSLFPTMACVTLGILAASPALGDVPWPTSSTVPDHIVLAARSGSGAVDPGYPYTMVIRHIDGRPFPKADVVLDLGSLTDVRVCTEQDDPNVVVNCEFPSVRGFTNANGELTLRLAGAAINNGASPGATGASINVYANGVFMNAVRVAALDENGADGLGGNDQSAWLGDFLSGQPYARSDFDGDGVLSGNDLSLWLGAFFSGASALGCGSAVCP